MTRFQTLLALGVVIAITGSVRLKAQIVIGSVTMDVDQDAGILVATCETDNDDSFYTPSVQCALYDVSGKKVAEQNGTPSSDNSGYAEVVLTFKGAPGVTYTAIASHFVTPNLQDISSSGGAGPDEDPFNFGHFAKEPATYENYNEWYGPEPDAQPTSDGQSKTEP